jgi:hypothetical protein
LEQIPKAAHGFSLIDPTLFCCSLMMVADGAFKIPVVLSLLVQGTCKTVAWSTGEFS